MANVNARRRCNFCWLKLCQMSLCQYNSASNKVYDWWLFLFLSYIASLLVGIFFVVAGFTSTDYEMAAVGVVLVIAGACLAIVCDLLRRFGCGWTKILTETASRGQISQENSDIVLSMPYLPGYPGFYAAAEDRSPDNPPPYAICDGCDTSDESTARSTSSSTCRTPLRTEHAQVCDADCGPPEAQLAAETFLRFDNLQELPSEPVETSVSPAGPSVLPASAGIEPGSQKPCPPPYDFVIDLNNEDRISWSCDSPPPYEDSV